MTTKTMFVSQLLLILIAIAGCSGAQPTAPAPTITAPTNMPTVVVPTVAPTNVPTNSPTTAPTTAPTIAPTATASSSAQSTQATANPLSAAIAKTRAATVFKEHEEMTMDQAFGATHDKTTFIRLDAELNGNDAHVNIGGTMVALFGLDPAATMEMMQVNGKTYAHGPVAGIGAPENKWYVLSADSGFTSGPKPFDTFDEIMKQKIDYASFSLARTSTDALACNFYRADKNVAGSIWSDAVFSATGVSPVVDDGYMEMSVCKDSYLHDLTINLTGHDSKDASKKGLALFRYSFTDFDTKIAIIAPTDAVPAVAPQGGLLGLFDSTATPTARATASAPTPTPDPNTVTVINGDWEGATDTDDDISFTVSNNQVTFVSLVLVAHTGSCSGSSSLAKSVSNAPVVNNAFTAKLTTLDGAQITFAGTFGGGQASGTISATGKLPCDATEIKTTWTAKNTSATASNPTPTATKSASSSSSASKSSAATSDSTSVVAGFFGAINNKNVDAALAFADDNIIYTFGSPTNSIGKDNLKSALTKLTSSGTTYTLSNYQAIGTIVKFSVRVSDGNTYSTSQAIIDNGKIVILTIK